MPYFGGKSRIAPYVWSRLGDTPNYCEPFLGSAAMLLARPDEHEWWDRTETVNDADSFLANTWRAIQQAPEEVARWADSPVIEQDLHARHVWLRGERSELTRKLEGDPDFYDPKAAGWWLWGMCCWIGGGWCGPSGNGPWESIDGEFVKTSGAGQKRKLPHLGDAGMGVLRKRPHLGDAGRGVHRQRPHLGDAGRDSADTVCEDWAEHLGDYMRSLANRLRRVRICCGDWSRIMGPTPTVKLGLTGVFLDPPYDLAERDEGCYSTDSEGVARDVRQWCVEHGSDPKLRIALCGYRGEGHEELEDLGWEPWYWKARGGYGSQADENGRGRANSARECAWFSPHCQPDAAKMPEPDLLTWKDRTP